ncbi:sensor histidine kinase [Candidatus Magnetomonas plexicatena]|uniref:sensor histidine kinase n=1 Tax=Candidatus Magnetomonas plexicatena TaxID=2552947 RepID=UPI0011042B63|nr:HAMP domain-containing histidine kinase [Nitrospirales bacterium LBB_01]
MRIGSKLLCLLLANIVLYGIIGYVVVRGNTQAIQLLEKITFSYLYNDAAIDSLLSAIRDSRGSMRDLLIKKYNHSHKIDVSAAKKIINESAFKRESSMKLWLQGMSKIESFEQKTRIQHSHSKDAFAKIEETLQAYTLKEREFITLYHTSDAATLDELFSDFIYHISEEIYANVSKIGEDFRSEIDSDVKHVKNIQHGLIIFSINAVLIASVAAIISGIYLRKQILVPINTLKTQTYDIGKNRLNTIINVTSKDEIGELTESFNEMVRELKIHRENLDELLYQRTNDLISSNEKLRQSEKQLVQSEKMAALAQLVAGIAHEINTPVGVGVTAASHFDTITKKILNSYAEKAMTKSDLEEYFENARESTDLILKNLYRTADLVRSFKMVSADQTSQELRKFKLKPYIDDVLLSLKPKLKKTTHTINVHCDDKIELNSYPGAYAQIITNLIVNTLSHAYNEGVSGNIKMDVSTDDTNVTLEYSDDGRGISEENIRLIFEPFFTTNRKQGGTGLGLHVLYNIVTQSLKGTIVCQSNTGEGAKFIITAPKDVGGNTNG